MPLKPLKISPHYLAIGSPALKLESGEGHVKLNYYGGLLEKPTRWFSDLSRVRK
jgi:hypothetical protein